MIFRRFYDDGLAQASYLIGCERAREAIVIDPNLALEAYVATAAAEGVRITDVTETHIHADFASGARALAAAAGAELHLSGDGGAGWQYGCRDEPHVHLLLDGDHLPVGDVDIAAMHTPGHTPEHLTFIVTDRARSAAPVGAVTGDFLFVGDVGRPDLLERAAGESGTMRTSAASLYHSVQRFKRLPDHLQIWPGHGAGSACGKAMSSAAQSTLGYERIANWALEPMSEHEFIERVLEGQQPPPAYFGAMKRRNREAALSAPSSLARQLEPTAVHELRDRVTIVDVRNDDEWTRGHVGGAHLIPLPVLHQRLAAIPTDRPIVVHCQRGARSARGAATLDAFGFTDVHEMTGGFARWESTGLPVER